MVRILAAFTLVFLCSLQSRVLAAEFPYYGGYKGGFNHNPRTVDRYGLTLGSVTEPFASVLGGSVHYNYGRYFRFSAGYGQITSPNQNSGPGTNMSTLGAEAKFFFIDGPFSPFVASGLSFMGGGSSGNVVSLSSLTGNSLVSAGTYWTLGIGVDWQFPFGFDVGGKLEMIPFGVSKAPISPGFYVGWFFSPTF